MLPAATRRKKPALTMQGRRCILFPAKGCLTQMRSRRLQVLQGSRRYLDQRNYCEEYASLLLPLLIRDLLWLQTKMLAMMNLQMMTACNKLCCVSFYCEYLSLFCIIVTILILIADFPTRHQGYQHSIVDVREWRETAWRIGLNASTEKWRPKSIKVSAFYRFVIYDDIGRSVMS